MAPVDRRWFDWVLLGNLLPDSSTAELARLRWPFNGARPQFVAFSPSGETRPEGNPTTPFLVTFVMLIPLFTSGGYLLQSLAQEKSSRVLEILLVSLRPQQLLTGKLIGLGGLALVQYAIWVGLALLALLLTGGNAAQFLAGTNLSAGKLLLVVPYAVGGFILYAALMAGIGALAPDPHNSRAWVFMITLPMLIPLYLWAAIVNAPHSGLAVGLSLFPFSAPVAMVLRLVSTTVPAWQLTASLLLLGLSGVGLVWLMTRLFRAQTLLSGQTLTLRRLWSALRSALA